VTRIAQQLAAAAAVVLLLGTCTAIAGCGDDATPAADAGVCACAFALCNADATLCYCATDAGTTERCEAVHP